MNTARTLYKPPCQGTLYIQFLLPKEKQITFHPEYWWFLWICQDYSELLFSPPEYLVLYLCDPANTCNHILHSLTLVQSPADSEGHTEVRLWTSPEFFIIHRKTCHREMKMQVIWVLAIADFVQRIISSTLKDLLSILQGQQGLLHWCLAGNCVCNKVHR